MVSPKEVRDLFNGCLVEQCVDAFQLSKQLCQDLSAPNNVHPVKGDEAIDCQNRLIGWAQQTSQLDDLYQKIQEAFPLSSKVHKASVVLSLDQLRAKFSLISTAETLALRPHNIRESEPLELVSAAALGHCWADYVTAARLDNNEQTDTCEVVEELLDQFEKKIAESTNWADIVRQAKDIKILDGQLKFVCTSFRDCLAGFRLATSLCDRPSDAELVMRWLLERSGKDNKSQQLFRTILSSSLTYQPEWRKTLRACGEKLIDVDPSRITLTRRLTVIKKTLTCDTILSDAKWYADDARQVPIAQIWAEKAGWYGMLPEIIGRLFDDPFERLKQLLDRVPIVDRYPLVRALRLSGRDASDLSELSTAIKCSLPDTTANELKALDKESSQLQVWLRLMRESKVEVTDNHLSLLVTILARRFTPSNRILAKLALDVLTAPHRDLQAVWKSLEDHRLSWVEELTDTELDQGNFLELAKTVSTEKNSAARLLNSRLEDRKMRLR